MAARHGSPPGSGSRFGTAVRCRRPDLPSTAAQARLPEASTTTPDPRELFDRTIDASEYVRIRELWKSHSMAEDRRDIAGLLATLTEDCVYEVVPVGHRWEGHAGARAFYETLLGAFPDARFDLTNIVIGPQGVYEEARLTATHAGDWLGIPATGRRVDFQVVIFFPWDPARGLFTGERVTFDAAGLASASRTAPSGGRS